MAIEVELRDVNFRYTGIGASEHLVLQNISLAFRKVECTAIVGPSGSGKTTLIQHFTGLLRPVSGQVLVDGQDIWQKKFDQHMVRRRIGLVFQFPEAQLFEETVFRDVAFAPTNFGLDEKEIEIRVKEALTAVGLTADAFGPRSPFHLSEGEKRRVAIAGVLAMQPEILVLDEPTAGLDAIGIHEIEQIIERLLSIGTILVVVTHNMDFVNNMANRAIVMREGAVVFDDHPDHLFADETFLMQMDLTMPNFLREKSTKQHLWPVAWREATSLLDLRKRIGLKM